MPVAGAPAVFDLLGTHQSWRRRLRARRGDSADDKLSLPLTGGPVLADFSGRRRGCVCGSDGVTAARTLSVDEIIARHRQYQTRLDALLHNYRAHVRMEQHFRPSLTDPGYDVVTENRPFVEGAASNGKNRAFRSTDRSGAADRPAFPLLQAEKVLSLPFELRLNLDYRYELAGTERMGDLECFRVRFDPFQMETFYRGTVWIDQPTFAKVRVQAVQTRTSAPIVSNEEVHTTRRSPCSQGPVRLPAHASSPRGRSC